VTIIDCRSGEVMVPGKSVSYGDGEKLKLIEVDGRLFGPRALIEVTYRDFGQTAGPLVTDRQWVPLTVRFTHPSFMLRRVGFIPS
jgi:hypothetical protein